MNVRRMPMSNLNDIFFTPAANQELTYDQVLEDVQRYFAENHASTIAEAGEGNAERATSLLKELMEHYIVKRKYALDGLSTKELCSKLYDLLLFFIHHKGKIVFQVFKPQGRQQFQFHDCQHLLLGIRCQSLSIPVCRL